MYQTVTSPSFDNLMTYISRQQGYFTAQQATTTGYSPQSQSYHVKEGHWERLARGIFRLKFFPKQWTDKGDLMVAYLWTSDRQGQPQGVLSHGTALQFWDLTTWLGPRNHMIVPKNFRRHSKCIYSIQLHYAELNDADTESTCGFRVTTPLKTIIDLLNTPHIERKHLCEGIEYALRKSLIGHRQMKEANLTAKDRELLRGLLRQIKYAKLDEI